MQKKWYDRGMTINVTCPFFKKCGGCLYQDLPFDTYLEKKKNFIERAFADRGLKIKTERIQTVPIHSRRRACFAFRNGKMGYNALKSHQIIEIDQCCLLVSEIETILPTLRQWTSRLKGNGDIFVLATEWGLDIHIKTNGGRPDLKLLENLAEIASHNAVARLSYNNEPIASKVNLPLPAEAFLQPSQAGEKILVDLVLRGAIGHHKAVDLFCGSGTFTKPLLKQGIKTIGYDCATDSVSLLGQNGIIRDLFRSPLLPEEMTGLDLIVLDPPRSGAKAQVEQIAKTQVPKVIMVSCNPITASRDAHILISAGWQLKSVVPIDQFTWSNHVEIVCFFER
jgi:23S rRNA (uracil1939-C5)-methyltransferase